jgi:hypothetical protein
MKSIMATWKRVAILSLQVLENIPTGSDVDLPPQNLSIPLTSSWVDWTCPQCGTILFEKNPLACLFIPSRLYSLADIPKG